MQINKIIINDWQQFGDINISFHPRLTIITGANGSGKTTILQNIIAQHFGWATNNLGTPVKNSITMITEWFSSLFDRPDNEIGELIYSNGAKASLRVPRSGSAAQYKIEIKNGNVVEGFFIPSHRFPYGYHPIDNISLRHIYNTNEAFSRVSNSTKTKFEGGSDRSSSYYIKEVLISWNILGHGNPDMPGNTELLENFKKFEEVLKIVLPADIGFKRIEIIDYEIMFRCSSGDFLLDASSGGLSTLIDLAWQVHMFSIAQKEKFTVVIDEVENHLHPTMQRRVLYDLITAFPAAIFIVSTHSPLIVNSVKESAVIALRKKESRVSSETLDLIEKPKTANEVLDEILGVSFTMPIWVEEGLNTITSKYLKKSNITKEDLSKMREELKSIGLERLIPEAIFNIAESND